MTAVNAKDYIAKLPKKRREAIRMRADELIAEELTLRELREARRRSQSSSPSGWASSRRLFRSWNAGRTCT